MIYVNDMIRIPDGEVEEKFVRSSGPGGQNVNKVSTAVQIRFNVRTSPSIPGDVKHRIFKLFGNRMSNEGFLSVTSDVHRTQLQNRDEVVRKFVEMIRAATVVPKFRRKTRVTLGAKKRRMESKSRKSEIKRNRHFDRDE
ncbi:MAG TPA: aminoacyl-tRNA hydrolase [Lentisphaeria bacterium]|nr:MAG: peptide chain release factor I [Lentisphaerae bacterium GWF2_50_93]HCE44756.1 aminoacyl-tRNA hydrolase [Lentisphaeria bacterium]